MQDCVGLPGNSQFLKSRASPAALFLAKGWSDAALQILNPAARTQDPQAAWLAAQILFDQDRYPEVRTTLKLHDSLTKSTKAQELMARSYLNEGNTNEAAKIYANIAKRSTEAKSYLSKQAFEARDFSRAYSLTQELLLENPDNPLLQANLELILNEKQRQGGNLE